MTVLGINHLVEFARKHPDARSALSAFQKEIENAEWSDPVQLKGRYPKASLVGKDNVVFDIRGGKYRLHARVSYAHSIFIIDRIGTHAEYDKWTF